ncbi:MAG: helix-turn-helix transcriptional regulator [Betaproteobacteria bacterium]|nr:helix-turn-helix transcriptional regulator [Betaproteobacteria bacterium]
MGELDQIIAAAKAELKARGLTYRDVAPRMGLSEASVKRLFASRRFTAERLIQVANLLGLTLAELAERADQSQRRIRRLTEAQERELVSSHKLILVAACVLNHWRLADITGTYRISETEAIRMLVKLDRLGLIALQPGNRIRLNVAQDFEWLPDGPIRRFFRSHWLADFHDSDFSREEEEAVFLHGMLTPVALAALREDIRRLRQRFAEHVADSLKAPRAQRAGTGLMLSMREWEPQEFTALRRKPAAD